MLKAPEYTPDHGWDSGFAITSGPHKGELRSPDGDNAESWQFTTSDLLLTLSVAALTVGVIGGNIRTVVRLSGVRPGTVRRARRLREAAALVAQDHDRAVEAVRDAWLGRGGGALPAAAELTAHGEPPDPETAALLTALRVLVDAGPQAAGVAAAGRHMTARLDDLLAAAEPATGWREMHDAGPGERARARSAVSTLEALLDEADARGLPEQFAQLSVDLLRTPEPGPTGLPAWLDYEVRPTDYQTALTPATKRRPRTATAPVDDPQGPTPALDVHLGAPGQHG